MFYVIRRNLVVPALLCVAVALPGILLSTPALASSELCSNPEVLVAGDHLVIAPNAQAAGAQVSLRGADGRVHETTVGVAGGASVPLVDAAGQSLPDGLVIWQVRFGAPSPGLRSQAEEGSNLQRPWTSSGAFTLKAGRVLTASAPELAAPAEEGQELTRGGGERELSERVPTKAQVFLGDISVNNSLCAGSSCVGSETFGDDTVRLKEVRLALHFLDTSIGGGYPSNDWRLLINDFATGGANYFALEDIDGASVPLKIEAGAPTDTLRVSSQGFIGVGTANPVEDVHLVSGDTPGLRLQQDTSSGFGAQVWSIKGNESSFFVEDTDTLAIPFRIRPDSPGNSLVIDDNGFIGLGTLNPIAALDVVRSDGTAQVSVRETSTTAGNIVVFQASSASGNLQTSFQPSSGSEWKQNFRGTDFRLDSQEDATNELVLDTAGNLTVSGTVVGSSDRAAKEHFAPVSHDDVLRRIRALPITTWSYRADDPSVRHLGPVAQDFHAAFGLGADERHIAPQDTASVALVGVQALSRQLEQKTAELEALKAANAALMERLEALERRLED